jgi:hypothetical protein
VKNHLLIPIICCLLIAISYNGLVNNNVEAQVNENKLEYIINQTNVATSPQIIVGDGPSYVSYFGNDSIIRDSVVAKVIF